MSDLKQQRSHVMDNQPIKVHQQTIATCRDPMPNACSSCVFALPNERASFITKPRPHSNMGGRILALTVLTSMLTTLVVSNAYYKKKQFYPTVVYLLNSNRSLGVLYLQGFLVVGVLCDFLKRLFFGTLRAAEVEVNTLKS